MPYFIDPKLAYVQTPQFLKIMHEFRYRRRLGTADSFLRPDLQRKK